MSDNEIENIDQQEIEELDPITDIVDYLVRCAKVSFKNAHVDQKEIRTRDKIQMACDLFRHSPTEFLLQFGKYLAPNHIEYFEKYEPECGNNGYHECIKKLKQYHTDDARHKRIRNRRYNALKKLQEDSDYFSEKQMMYRSPLLYEQLVGQYLTEAERKERDGVDTENLTFLNLILETVDRNQMRETKNEQMLEEDLESMDLNKAKEKNDSDESDDDEQYKKQQWGEFDTPCKEVSFKPKVQAPQTISAPERRLLKEEFFQEMYCSFVEGRDDIDYTAIDNDEQYDDLQQVSQDAEDRYFDSEPNDSENLEEHMKLVTEYGRKNSTDSNSEDPLDLFMKHLNKQQVKT